MTLNYFFEGANSSKLIDDFVAFDIETFSSNGFPFKAEDPVVDFSFVIPLGKGGVLSLSVIAEPSLENGLLLLLHQLLLSFRDAIFFTYNGSKFDFKYVAKRGEMYGLNFEEVFADIYHIDVYRLIRWLDIKFPKYSQKSIERYLGIPRVIQHVSGMNYHLFYEEFLKVGSLTPLFYNIEDSFGCLRIASAILRDLDGRGRR